MISQDYDQKQLSKLKIKEKIKKLESEKEFIEESLEERLEPLQISDNNEVILKSVDHHKFIQRKEY